MRIFVDIGSHEGQTLEEVLKDHWGFDMVHAVEPMPRQLALLQERYGRHPRVQIWPLALSDFTGTVTMYGTNDLLEASVYSSKNDVDPEVWTAVPCLDAGEFFAELPPGDVFVNLNCEGAEVPILHSLIDSGAIDRISAMLVSFDISKVVGFQDAEFAVRERLARIGFDRFTSDYPPGETHQEQIAGWLTELG